MTERLVPFYCPYCGEESLEPVGRPGQWHCRDCTRNFTLRSGLVATSERPVEVAP